MELLVVIGIIGLLASILVVNLTSARRRARDTKRISDVRSLQVALEDYYGKNGKYPALINDLVTGGQIPIMPKDPLAATTVDCEDTPNTDNCYYYASYPATNAYTYHLGSSMEESGSLLLNQDRDCNSINGDDCPQDVVYVGTPFNGVDTVGCGSAANRYCYDVAQ